MAATVIGPNPASHRRESEVGDAHRLLLVRFGEDLLALGWWEQVEQLCRGDNIDIQSDAGVIEQRQRFVNEFIHYSGALQHDSALCMPISRTQPINPFCC